MLIWLTLGGLAAAGLGWLMLTGAATFSLVWWIGVALLVGGVGCLLPAGEVALVTFMVVFGVLLVLAVLIEIIKYFGKHVY
jgi:hypothetical protein